MAFGGYKFWMVLTVKKCILTAKATMNIAIFLSDNSKSP